ncbi:MAG: hypothetical protein AAGA26_03790 [Pseudomonadota bacterium]
MPVLRTCLLLLFVSTLSARASASDAETCSFSTDWGEREAACTRLIESGSVTGDNLSSALTNRCKARLSELRYDSALQDCNEAIGTTGTNWQAFDIRAVIYLGLGRYPAALDDLDRAERLNADWPARARARADTLCSMKRADEAMLQYRRAIQRGAFDAVGWQTFLSEAGFYSGEIDGVFGQGSMRALQSWVAATCR